MTNTFVNRLLTLVAAVQFQPPAGAPGLQTADALATEWLADSYWLQSQSKLPEALAAAQKATAALRRIRGFLGDPTLPAPPMP